MSAWRLTRRTFLKAASALGLAAVTGCEIPGDDLGNGVIVFRRSGRGRRVSNAAKKHNANHLYAREQAAASDPAHPGDNSKVVQAVIPRQLFVQLFGGGQLSADLRHAL